MYNIRVSFRGEDCPTIIEKVNPGQTLLEILLKNDIGLSHDCGGVCSCSSCHVYILQGSEFLEEAGRREKDFIRRSANPMHNSRLGCQCLLLEGEGVVEVVVGE